MKTPLSTREMILRNCDTDFYGDEIIDSQHKFTPHYFATIRDNGYTAIWIRGQLRDLVHYEEAPHWDNKIDERIAALTRIIESGHKAGVGIYLYFNEPKGLCEPEPLYEKYPDLKGQYNPLSENPNAAPFEPTHAFCTRSAFAETYLVGGFKQLFEKCPSIAGVILMTASEIVSHCYSHVHALNLLNEEDKLRTIQCPRCAQSNAVETVIDVVSKIRDGIRAAGSSAKVVAWNWSWGMFEAPPQPQIISGLPQDVAVLCDMQRGGGKTVDGIEMFVDEYSFSYLGPSPLFYGVVETCEKTGHELWAKLMVNTTHEFLVVPYLPLLKRLAKKMIAVRDLGSRGFLGCWNYGGHPYTPMAKFASRIFHDDNFGIEDIDDEVRASAVQLYGEKNAPFASRAWDELDAAFEYFPFTMSLIYYGPHMHGTGFEWHFTPEEIPMPWYFVHHGGRGGTRLSDWMGSFTPEQVIELFTKLTDRWKAGVEILATAFGVKNPFDEIADFAELANRPGFEDFSIARTVYLHYMSTIGFLKFRLATLRYFENEMHRDAEKTLIRELLEAEKSRCRAMKQIVARYPGIPISEEACKLLYSPEDMDAKMKNIAAFDFQEGAVI